MKIHRLEISRDIDFAHLEIERAKAGGVCDPYSTSEWIQCMWNRINAGLHCLSEINSEYKPAHGVQTNH